MMITFYISKQFYFAFLIIAFPVLIFAQQDTSKKERLVEVKFDDGEMITSSNIQEEVFSFVEQMPEFPGGQDSLYNFIWTHIRYPAEARRNSISGKVVLQFIVNKYGMLENIRVVNGVHPSLDAEALRVVGLMNEKARRWRPGKQGGKAVSVYFTLPIKFSLE
jgi:TonB family protein